MPYVQKVSVPWMDTTSEYKQESVTAVTWAVFLFVVLSCFPLVNDMNAVIG